MAAAAATAAAAAAAAAAAPAAAAAAAIAIAAAAAIAATAILNMLWASKRLQSDIATIAEFGGKIEVNLGRLR